MGSAVASCVEDSAYALVLVVVPQKYHGMPDIKQKSTRGTCASQTCAASRADKGIQYENKINA